MQLKICERSKNMKRQEIFDWTKKVYNTEPDYPWNDDNAVLRHKKNRKWYAIVLKISRRKLGIEEDTMVDILNVKGDPMLIASLREQPGYFPAYHMNKEKWISILLDGTVPEENIKNLVDISYELTK